MYNSAVARESNDLVIDNISIPSVELHIMTFAQSLGKTGQLASLLAMIT